MSIIAFPFTSINHDRRVSAAMFRKFMASFASSGVMRKVDNKLLCTKSGMNIIIGTGAALFEGGFAAVTAPETVPITAASTARIAVVVLEFNNNTETRDAVPKVLYGSSTTPPALTQTETVYQIALCQLEVPANATSLANVTLYDRREYSSAQDYQLPVGSATTLGGIQTGTKTDADTQPVHVDMYGGLWTAPAGSPAAQMVGNPVFYGSCTGSNSGSAQNKSVICGDTNFALPGTDENGLVLNVFFQYAQSYEASSSNPLTLNVNNTGAKQVYRYSGAPAGAGAWKAGEVVSFVYSGNHWLMLNGSALHDGEGGSGGGGGGSYTLPVANSTTLGGVMTGAKTSADTQEVHVDGNGGLWTQPGSGGGSGLSSEAKTALMALLAHVSYTDENGSQYYEALRTALDASTPPVANLRSISATFVQGSSAVYESDSLESLRQRLTVTATYTDSSTGTITNYALSGTLAAGTSTITVSYGGKTTTFTVTVTADDYLYRLTESDFTREAWLQTTAPDYYTAAASMESYVPFDLILESGKTYSIEWETTHDSTATLGGKIYKQGALTNVTNQQDISSANLRDLSDWLAHSASPYNFTLGSDEVCVRLMIRQNAAQAITNDFAVVSVKIKEVTA